MAKIASTVNKSEENTKKDKYRVVNWSNYNKSLIGRGDITIWISEEVADSWYYDGPDQRGAQFEYSDKCIECLLGIKAVFQLRYRQLQGFSESLLKLMDLDLKVPSYTQICRRAEGLEIDIQAPKSKESIYIVVDSTGLKVFGEGEWKTRKHGVSKRRTWRKLHLGVDEKTGFIHASVLTENGKGDGDAQQVEEMLGQVECPIGKFGGDGAYDTRDIWELLEGKGIEGIIPPQKNAVYWVDEKGDLEEIKRNEILKEIEKDGRAEWKKKSGYHRRSLSETAMFRFKTIFGSELYSRKLEKQKTEAKIKVKCLNIMTGIGMPISQKIAS